jgi:hypothetical protein
MVPPLPFSDIFPVWLTSTDMCHGFEEPEVVFQVKGVVPVALTWLKVDLSM